MIYVKDSLCDTYVKVLFVVSGKVQSKYIYDNILRVPGLRKSDGFLTYI